MHVIGIWVIALSLVAGLSPSALASPSPAQLPELIGATIVEVRVEQEGRALDDRLISGLLETKVGEPLTMGNVRQSVEHLTGLNRFDDVQVVAEPAVNGVRVRYVLVPTHAVERLEFRGTLGLKQGELRQIVAERFGSLPSASRVNEVARTLGDLYRERGFIRARVTPKVEEFHDPDRAVLVFEIDAGPRATIQRVDVEGLESTDRLGLLAEDDLRVGQPYDRVAVQQRLDRYVEDLRARGFYEARATHTPEFTPEGQVMVEVDVARGPHVSIAFAGDPLPTKERDELVPLRREGSVDEDLLEDASRAIEDYLHARGYKDAQAPYTREQKGDELIVTFAITRGTRYVLDSVEVKGNTAIATGDLIKQLRLETGEPFQQSAIDRAVTETTQLYHVRGYTRVKVEPVDAVLPNAADGAASERRVQTTLNISEGPRTLVASVAIQGNSVLNEGEIRELMTVAPGRPYSVVELEQDRSKVELEYLNRGYQNALVEREVAFSDGDARADVRLKINEGPQILVDHIIIVGNERTSNGTIQRALLLKPGQPLGYSARVESQQRLVALGLFRRVEIIELRHGSDPRRDVLVRVAEAPPTTIGYGGGVEGGTRLRPGPSGQAEERFELAPRGSFEIGRRNLFGKNRSINLFTRVALKTRDADVNTPEPESSYGFNEYRVVAAYREPRVLNTMADALITATLDQAIRSSFNFRSRELRGEVSRRFKQIYGVSGRYSFEQNDLFDVRLDDGDDPVLIDRIFPQVRLSKLSLSVLRDTRNDALDPDRGIFLSADNDVALRAIGSEVGFMKTLLQASTFRRLPSRRRMVARFRGIIGLAQGFEREVEQTDANGVPVTVLVKDLPASERFFAGGDTSVRGFSLDRLGTEETTTESGFPRGGNGMIVLNSELLVNVWRALDVVGFLDSGNVYPRAGDIDITNLRASSGFGIRYRSPVGPIRIDLGFNLDPRELVPGTLERRSVLHVSLGQAF